MQGVSEGARWWSVESGIGKDCDHGTVLGLGQDGRYQRCGRSVHWTGALSLLWEGVMVWVGGENVKEAQKQIIGTI